MEQVIEAPTHYTGNNATLLDVIATTSADLIEKSEVLTPSLSNHCDITAHLNLTKPKMENYKKKVYSYDKANWQEINRQISENNWENILRLPNIDEQVEAWTSKITQIVDGNIPNRNLTTSQNQADWMTRTIQNMRKKKAAKHTKAKKSGNEKDWEALREARDKLSSEIRETKEKYEERLSKRIKACNNNDDKLWWKLTKNFYARTNNTKHLSPPLVINGKPTTSNLEKATAFNDFFAKMSTIDADEDEIPPLGPDEVSELSQIRFNVTTVKEVLAGLNPNKAKGPDNISPRVLKECSETIAPTLARLYNFSMETGTYPKLWKLANISPIHKKGNKCEVENYRPVSLLSVAGKCMERVIHKEMDRYFTEHKIISNLQAAFRAGNSTTWQLLELYNEILRSMDDRKEVLFCFCDVSKAFDRVWHKGLLRKLHRAGIRGKLLKWLEHYLKNRTHRVVVNGKCSEEVEVEAGVPQGSILGPLLFILYI
jgi:hypothetical protein